MAEKIRILLMKMITTFYRRAIVVVRPIDHTIPEVNSRLPIVMTLLSEEDLPRYIQLRPDQDLNMIKMRLANGDQCFAVRHEGRIVHTGWVTTKPKHEPYLRTILILQPKDIFLYDHYTHPSLRHLGLAQARDVHTLHHYREKGYRRSIAIVAVENRAAFRPFKAMGYRSIGMFKCLRLGPWQCNWEERWGEDLLPLSTKTGMRKRSDNDGSLQ
jgi:ribosomal protein S18 acetylase RimI-like enzyme